MAQYVDNNGLIYILETLKSEGASTLAAAQEYSDNIAANYVLAVNLEAAIAELGYLTATSADLKYAAITDLDTVQANISDLTTEVSKINDAYITTATVETLLTEKGYITLLETNDLLTAYVKTTDLDATIAEIEKAIIDEATIDEMIVNKGYITVLETNDLLASYVKTADLETSYLKAEDAELKYANIDFANITQAAIERLFTDSGIIGNLVMSDGYVTGTLVGVTVKGDLIEAGTIVADKLVILGDDGLYYKLNTNGSDGVTSEQTEYNSLNGSVITAQSVTAEKISVDDLVAFGATLGGFVITTDSIYSGAKESVDNTTRGIYLDNDGQVCFGDADNYIKYWKDTDGEYKLSVKAKSITLGSSSSTLEEEIETLKDEVTTNLKILSSRGTVFKNNNISTTLSVVIYRGSDTISDIDTLHSIMGSSAYLEWKYRGVDDEEWKTILSTDSRIGNGGFSLDLTPDDIDTQMSFTCELNA